MTWWALVEAASGRLHSVGSVLADPVPPEFTAMLMPSQLDQDRTLVWSVATRAFVVRPVVIVPTPIEILMAQPEIQAMNQMNKDRVLTAITRVQREF